jgi:transcriptional regulator with XRE-family HTH domain
MRTGEDWGNHAGQLLIQRRRAMGLTQEDLAQRSALSVRAISDLERGHTRKPRPRSIQLLAAALEMSPREVAHFFGLLKEPRPAPILSADGIGRDAEMPADRFLPRQIPMAARHFSGRQRELQVLSALLDDDAESVGLTVISGPPGIGKTALAVYWAHQVSDRFPHGQLHVDLCGCDITAPSLAAAEAIRRFLEAFDVPPARIPAGLEARAALYRSLLAKKRVLIMLDGAQDADQVRPLLPGSAGCLVVVTSRKPLLSLVAGYGARPITLDGLSADDAREFLGRLLGPRRVAAEPEAVTELVERCNRSPLALSMAAAHAALSPTLRLSALLSRMPQGNSAAGCPRNRA